jgi:hypothetical protein
VLRNNHTIFFPFTILSPPSVPHQFCQHSHRDDRDARRRQQMITQFAVETATDAKYRAWSLRNKKNLRLNGKKSGSQGRRKQRSINTVV